MAIEDTSKRDSALHLLGMAGGSEQYITGMEAAGQAQLVNSDRLPTKRNGDEDWLAVGFTFGPPDARDPLFCQATLPAGWKRAGSDHSMWSYLVDQLGRRRVAIFYKAAFYDRDAFMHLETPTAYLRHALYDGTKPVLDDEWMTREVAASTLTAIAAAHDRDANEADGFAISRGSDDSYWKTKASEDRIRRDAAWAMRDNLPVTS